MIPSSNSTSREASFQRTKISGSGEKTDTNLMIPSEAKNADMDATLFYKYAYILITTGSLQ